MSLIRRIPSNVIASLSFRVAPIELSLIVWRAGTRIRAELRARC